MNLQKLKRFFVAFIVTAGGAGFFPKAPGTAGTVMGVILVSVLRGTSLPIQWGIFLCLFLLGWWASIEWSKLTQLKDAQTIVIDEVLGYWLTLLLLDQFFGPVFEFNARIVAAFIAFRIFDVIKPPPIRQLDRWGKKFEIGAVQSVMVTVDDLLAGVYATGSIVLLNDFLRLCMSRF